MDRDGLMVSEVRPQLRDHRTTSDRSTEERSEVDLGTRTANRLGRD